MKPTKPIRPGHVYVPASATDIRKTFARIRKQLAEEAKAAEAATHEVKVRKIK
jgi:hypothetical protein